VWLCGCLVPNETSLKTSEHETFFAWENWNWHKNIPSIQIISCFVFLDI
jgi:hypothetical protein